MSAYRAGLKKLFYWPSGLGGDVWFYDPETNAWTLVKPKGPPPPFGIDASACLDLKRERIYIGGGYYPVSKGPHAFWCYDLKTNTWVDLKPEGKPCSGCNRYGPNHAIMNYDSANDVVVLIFHRWQMAPTDGDVQPGVESRGVYVYNPTANSWSEKPLAMPKEIGQCPSGFYNPDLNAHFVHVAGDSADNGDHVGLPAQEGRRPEVKPAGPRRHRGGPAGRRVTGGKRRGGRPGRDGHQNYRFR